MQSQHVHAALIASPVVIEYEHIYRGHFLAAIAVEPPGLTEVRDSQGTVLGYFSPAAHKSPEAYAQAAAHFDSEEMQRRKLSKEKGRTTREVLSRIATWKSELHFTVTWHPSAEQELAEIWLQASDRGGRHASRQPHRSSFGVGAAHARRRLYGDRMLVSLPLAVTYTVSQPDRSVQILQVRHPWVVGQR